MSIVTLALRSSEARLPRYLVHVCTRNSTLEKAQVLHLSLPFGVSLVPLLFRCLDCARSIGDFAPRSRVQAEQVYL